jgi:hypothetical protein
MALLPQVSWQKLDHNSSDTCISFKRALNRSIADRKFGQESRFLPEHE